MDNNNNNNNNNITDNTTTNNNNNNMNNDNMNNNNNNNNSNDNNVFNISDQMRVPTDAQFRVSLVRSSRRIIVYIYIYYSLTVYC